MTDRDTGTSSGDGQEPKAPGAGTPPSGDVSPHAPDSGIGEDKPNTSLIPQPPIFDQDLIQALRNNLDAEKLSLTDARLINKFLRENGVELKEYRKMDAKTKVAAAADKVELRISSYITDADAYAKKKVEEKGFTSIENFDSPFGPGDSHTVESQKKAFRNRLLSGVQDATVQPGTLEAIYLREIRVSVLEKWLNSNHFPDLYTFWAKSPDDIITESGINTRIDDEDKERFLNEQDQPVPLRRSMDEYANGIRELEAGIPTGEVSGDTATNVTTFAKVIEARKHIMGASVGSRDQLVKVDSKLKDTFKILASRRLVRPLSNGGVEDLTDEVIRIKNGNGKPGNGSEPEPDKPGTATGPEPSPAPSPEENPDIDQTENISPNWSERIKKMEEEARQRAEKFLETMEQRLRDEIPAEELQAVLNYARTSIDDIDSDSVSQIFTDLENRGIHISDEIKDELKENVEEQATKIDYAELLRSFVKKLPKKDSAKFLLETRYGEDLINISQDQAKQVLDSLITASNSNNLDEEDTGIRSKAKKFLSRFWRKKEKEPKKPKAEKSPKQPDFIDLGVEKESIWAKAGKTFRKFTSRREKEEKEVVQDSDAEKAKKAKRARKIAKVAGVIGIGALAFSLAYCVANNGSGDGSPTISPARESVLTAQAKATAKAERSATPTVQTSEPAVAPSSEPTTAPTSEPTAAPTTAPGENQPTPPAPPSQPQGQIRSSEYSHDQAAEALDLADGVKDGFVNVNINVSGTNFDNAQAQTLGASGLNLINKDNLYENGALRWKWTLLASDGNGEKYHWVNVGDQIRIPADKLADAYRWSNVQVPENIAGQIKQVSTLVDNKNESVVNGYGKDKQQKAVTEKTAQSGVGFSETGENISGSNLNGEIDVKSLAPNVKVHVASTQEEFQNSKNSVKSDGNIGFVNDIVDSPVQSPITKKTPQQKYSPTTNFKTKKEDEQMRFIAAMFYERERQKQLKRLSLKLNFDDDDEKEDTILLPNI